MPRRASPVSRACTSVATLPFRAALADETSSWSQGAKNSRNDAVGVAHPVQRRVAEHGIEAANERQLLTVDDSRIEPARACRRDHLRARVDTDDMDAHGGQLLRQGTVAAAEVEDALARTRPRGRSTTGWPRSETNRAFVA
jgi:hypothetical protein